MALAAAGFCVSFTASELDAAYTLLELAENKSQTKEQTPSIEEMERDVITYLTTHFFTPHVPVVPARNLRKEISLIGKVLIKKSPDVNIINNKMIPIGTGHAKVPARVLKQMNWNSHTACTRKLLSALFPRKVLATHSLTGKPSPAFPNKPAKKMLDPLLIDDIVQIVSQKCSVSKSQVRTSITTKCADECKMLRTRQRKSSQSRGRAKEHCENIPPSSSTDSDSDEQTVMNKRRFIYGGTQSFSSSSIN